MTPHDSRPRPSPWALALPIALACVAWLLYQRNFGLHPIVFADEWYYSKMARLIPLADAIVPSYLYLWMFGATAACGDAYLECARGGNLAFFLAASPFVYLTARRFASRPVAFAVALLAALAPLNVYTAYFMPEATYYFGFWVLSWVALTRGHWHPALQALALGVVLGMMSLVKVHALFLLPALCPFLLYASWNRGGPWLLRGLAMAAGAAAVTVGVKFGLGWLLAGDAGLSLLGPFYQGSVNAERSKLALIAPAFVNGRGHLAALALLYGVPLAIVLYELCARVLRVRGDERNPLHVYALLMLGAAAGMTVLYTATLAMPGSQEGLRLHLRYYSFVFPLLAIVAAAAIRPRSDSAPSTGLAPLRWIIVVMLGILLAFAWVRLHTYSLNAVDGPEVGGIALAGWQGKLLVALQLVLLLAWAARVRGAVLAFLLVALPASMAAGHLGADRYLESHRPPGNADLAGKAMRDLVPPADRGSVVVVGNDMAYIMRVQFQLDHPDSVPMLVEQPGPLPSYMVPISKKWLVLVGDGLELPQGLAPLKRGPQYAVVRLPDPAPLVGRLQLSAQPDPQFITGMEGLSVAEPWGRWSDAKQVVIHFTKPLPRKVGVVLSARAFDVNATLPFTAQVGEARQEFRLGWHLQEIALHFDTDGNTRTLVIDVPRPISPEDVGHPGDPRKLGIGIAELTINDATQTVHASAKP